ncbi:MAG: rod shape-determining protein RodA [Candidatus Comchoanobacterales bacterium]
MNKIYLTPPSLSGKKLKPWDTLKYVSKKPILQLILLLCCYHLMSVIVIYSAFGFQHSIFMKHIVKILISWGIFYLCLNTPFETIKTWIPIMFIASIGMLFLVFLMGHTGKGAQRWLSLGPLTGQPSEIIKITLPLMLTYYLAPLPSPISWRQLFWALVMSIIPIAFVLKQPDLGTAILSFSIFFIIIFIKGMPKYSLIIGTLVVIIALPFTWSHLHDYQKQRILTLIHPEQDIHGKGYHIHQSKIAIGSGGLWGKNLNQGTQSHLNFLPENHTDFIFAHYAEEFGFIGSMLFLGLAMITAINLCRFILSVSNHWLLLFGFATLGSFSFNLFVNIGMVCGILPVVGIPLPLVSYGGSSLLITMMNFGLLVSLWKQAKAKQRLRNIYA